MDLVSRVQGYRLGCYGQQAEWVGGTEAGRRGVLPLSFPCLLHTYLDRFFAIFGPQCLVCPAAQPLPAEGQSYQGHCIHLQLGATVGAGSFSFGPL